MADRYKQIALLSSAKTSLGELTQKVNEQLLTVHEIMSHDWELLIEDDVESALSTYIRMAENSLSALSKDLAHVKEMTMDNGASIGHYPPGGVPTFMPPDHEVIFKANTGIYFKFNKDRTGIQVESTNNLTLDLSAAGKAVIR